MRCKKHAPCKHKAMYRCVYVCMIIVSPFLFRHWLVCVHVCVYVYKCVIFCEISSLCGPQKTTPLYLHHTQDDGPQCIQHRIKHFAKVAHVPQAVKVRKRESKRQRERPEHHQQQHAHTGHHHPPITLYDFQERFWVFGQNNAKKNNRKFEEKE